jgi:predicted permease
MGITFGPFNRDMFIEGHTLAPNEPVPQADFRVVSPEYFDVIGLPLIKGRLFTDMDHDRALNVAIINQSMARHRWNNEDPVGRRVSFDQGRTWVTIVGVVGDVKQYGLNSNVTDELYRPLAQNPGGANLLVRTAADPLAMSQQLREAVYKIDSETAISDVQTLEEIRSESLASPRLTTILLGLFAVLALTITAAGLGGVMALWVSQRTQEIGIRIALGASPAIVQRMGLRQGLTLVLTGLALGLLGAIVLTRFISAMLFGVEPTDPITYMAVLMVYLGVAAVACFVPARTATTIDPLVAVRTM